MFHRALFEFFLSLNDFLTYSKRNTLVNYSFKDNPSIKDAIEALGIPHPEIDFIIVNERPVNFSYKLHNNDEVKVYPVNPHSIFRKTHSLIPDYTHPLTFVADVNLGKLAKALRMLGVDSTYQNYYSDQEIAELAKEENRIVLTRDVALLKQKTIRWGYWLRSQKVENQLQEVVKRFHLSDSIMPFKRCLACNGLIEPVMKDTILGQIPPKTIECFNEFFRCCACKRVYWKGSHYENMNEWISNFKKTLETSA